MKKQVLAAIGVIVLVLAAIVFLQTSGQAQTNNYTIRANVPFQFVVRGETMPAGDYVVQIPSATAGPLMIQQKKGSTGFVIQLPVTEAWSEKPQLVFHQFGSTYFLYEVCDSRAGVHRVAQSDRYYQMAKASEKKEVIVEGK